MANPFPDVNDFVYRSSKYNNIQQTEQFFFINVAEQQRLGTV